MTRRWNIRFLVIGAILALLAARELIFERRASWLRPGRHIYAYVNNSADGTLSVLDLVRLASIATIPVGPSASNMRQRPKSNEIWGLSSAGYAWVVNGEAGQIVAEISVGSQPSALNFSPDGKIARVALAGANQIVEIDAAQRQLIRRAQTGHQPSAVAQTHDGKHMLVANRGDATLSILDAQSLSTLSVVNTAPNPKQIEILPDDSKAFLTSVNSSLLSVVNLSKNALVTQVSLGGVGSDMILKPDGGELYIPSADAHGLIFVNTATNEVADFLLLGLGPQSGVLAPDGLLFVTDPAAGRIVPVIADDRLAQPSIPAGEGPVRVGFTPGGEMILVVDRVSNDVAVLRDVDDKMITMIPTGRQPDAIVVLLF